MTRGRERRVAWTLFVLSFLIQVPFLRRGISYFDEGSILAIADRLRHGEVLYRDRATFVAPLTYEVIRLLFTVFGPSLLVARIFMAVVFSVCAVLVHAILRAIAGPRAALVGAIAFVALKPMGFPAWTMVNYSQLGMMLCLAAVWLVLRYVAERRRSWLALAALVIGVAIATKQNLGALVGTAIATALVADAVRTGRPLRELVGECAILALAAAPLAAVALYYGAHGALDELVARTIVQVPSVIAQYGPIPLPGLTRWSAHPDAFTTALFPYFPSPLWQVVLEEHWQLARQPTALVTELAVRIVYYAPLVAIAWCVVRLWRARHDRSSVGWSGTVMIVTFASAAYVSMLYRADWTHLMNIYPALLLACVVAWCDVRGVAGRAFRTAAVGAWVASALVIAAVIVRSYRAPVDTPRGRLFATPPQAEDTARVLAHVAALPAHERVAFLHYDPLYYFLTGREIPLAFDIVHPGYIGRGDDEATARELGRVDEVVYNPKIIPTITTPFTAYAPRTASVVANDFRVSAVLAPSAYVLRRASPAPASAVVLDLWDRFDALRPAADAQVAASTLPVDAIARVHWLAARVVRTTIDRYESPTCFVIEHTVGPGEQILTTPFSDPALWRGAERDAVWVGADPAVRVVRFEITARARDRARPAVVLYGADRPVDAPGVPITVSLAELDGDVIDLRFCAAAVVDGRRGPTRMPVGWAEPRIVRLLPGAGHDGRSLDVT